MVCKNCGKEIPDNVQFCPGCGKNVIVNTEKKAGIDFEQTVVRKKSNLLPFIIGGGAVALVAVVVVIFLVIVIGGILISNNPQSKYDKQLSLGQKYMNEMDYDRAIAAYKTAIEIDPNNPEAYEVLAELYMAVEEYESAHEVLSEGIDATESQELKSLLSVVESAEVLIAQENGTQTVDADVYDVSDENEGAEEGNGADGDFANTTDNVEENADDNFSWKEGYREALDEYASSLEQQSGMDRDSMLTFYLCNISDDGIPSIVAYGPAGGAGTLWYVNGDQICSAGFDCDIRYAPYGNTVCLSDIEYNDYGYNQYDQIYTLPDFSQIGFGRIVFDYEMGGYYYWGEQDVPLEEAYIYFINECFPEEPKSPDHFGNSLTYDQLMESL